MKSPLSPRDVAIRLAQTLGVSVEQASAFLQAHAELAYEEAARGFPVAGIGLLYVDNRPERKMVMRFGPKEGQEVTIPATKKLEFRVAKVAKDVILGSAGMPSPNVLDIDVVPNEAPPED